MKRLNRRGAEDAKKDKKKQPKKLYPKKPDHSYIKTVSSSLVLKNIIDRLFLGFAFFASSASLR